MTARIFRPAKTAMSSGRALTRHWVLEIEPERPLSIEPLMGYTSSDDTRRQIRVTFDTREEAVAYAERHGIPYHVLEPKDRRRATVAYSDNFRRDRAQPWTH